MLHPKLFLTPAVLARAKQRVQANSPLWQAVKSHAASGPESDSDVINVALAYALTGTASYADRAISGMANLAAKPVTAIDRDHGYDARTLLPAMALGFDWCYYRLTLSQRQSFGARMVAWSERIWPETGGGLAAHWGDWPAVNYWHGDQATWMVGLALTGEGLNAEPLAAQALARHKAKAMPWMTQKVKGGYLEEGSGYGLSGSLMWAAHYLTAALTTGTAPAEILPPEWYPSVLRAMIHMTTPDRRHLYPGGDQARVSSAPLSAYSVAAVLGAMDYLSAEDAGMARYWFDEVYPAAEKIGWTAWMPLLWYRDDVPFIDYTKLLQRFYAMPGTGAFSSRSSWAADAVQVVAVAGPVTEDHQDQAGHFHIVRGADTLAGMQKIWGASGIEHAASALNTVLIGGLPQNAKSSPKALFATDTPSSTSWGADLTDTYDTLDEWRREVMFLKPGFVIVFDRVRTKAAATEKKWQLHSLNAPSINGNLFQVSAGGSTLYGTPVLLPIGATVTQERLSTGSYRTSLKSSISPAYFLNVLEILPSEQPPTLPIFATPASGNVRTLRLGSSAVEVTLDATTAPALRVVGDQPPPPPPPPSALTVRITNFAPDPAGAVFYGVVNDTAPLAAGSTISVVVTTPSGTTATVAAPIGGVPPPPPPSGALYLEAESAVLVAPMTLRTVAGASGAGTDTPNSGSATFTVPIPTAGTWYLWARVQAPDPDHDSFVVTVDGVSDIFDAAENSWAPGWRWTRLNGRGGIGNPMTLNPRKLTLTVGPHTIRFAGREPGTLLDRLALSMDPAFRPE